MIARDVFKYKFSEINQSSKKYSVGTKNWENTNIFGTISSLSNDDYKNMAYYQVQVKANDNRLLYIIMLRHG